jgi:hypothetical protein
MTLAEDRLSTALIPESTATSLGDSSRAWFAESIEQFNCSIRESILGRLTGASDFAVLPEQRDAWLKQIELLQTQLAGRSGSLFLEFTIPRMGQRVDAILLIGPVVFVLEFKVGDARFERAAQEQVWDYALDLKNFHEGSHAAAIVPILIATAAKSSPPIDLQTDHDGVFRPIPVHPDKLRSVVDFALARIQGEPLHAESWLRASYRPTPTIVEAARALYAHHSVEAIKCYDAGKSNLRVTSCRIEELVDEARAQRRKLICFVTGVPGAGKTLVGLNIATQRREADQPTHAVFLSGNGPLVAVLHEALASDEAARQKSAGQPKRKREIRESVKAFIQNVHHFRDDLLADLTPPPEHVTIFDEAQRAWTLEKTADFMKRKRHRPDFAHSEPEFLISCMDRHSDWAAIVCLVGGGQEIHTGEAGIDAWINAVNTSFPHWHMHISSRLIDHEYAAGGGLGAARNQPNCHFDDCLHLAVSMRSFRAENVSQFVKALLDCQKEDARALFKELRDRYPLAVTRDLIKAKAWVRQHARGTDRYGLVASSKARRLKPDAIDIRFHVKPVQWFLNDKEDTRSSYYLEDTATEFDVQGLELDWTIVAWDADLRFAGAGWKQFRFRGRNWCKVKKEVDQRYLLNAYRVLLTRARQGMMLYVPRGDTSDKTRLPGLYDGTYHYLTELGLPEIV